MTRSEDEKRGYARGYAAGRGKRDQEAIAAAEAKERQAFLDRVFIECVVQSMVIENWTRGDKRIVTHADRVGVARDFAIEALNKRPRA